MGILAVMLHNTMSIEDYDIELWTAIQQEINRQEQHIELIASENYSSVRVMEAQGSQLTNKYAEGYPGKRYYSGCEYIDVIERLSIDRAKKLFNADYANVQPHSGSQANFAVYNALLNPGDVILGMHLSHGGHLTHGSLVNFSGKLYKSIHYGVDSHGVIDYSQLAALAQSYRPKIIVGGFSSYSGIVDWAELRKIADEINSYLLVDMAHIAGLVASDMYPSPLPYAHVVTATTHKTLAGPRGGLILACGGSKEFYKTLDSAVFPGSQGGPLMHVIAAKAIAFKEAMEPSFKEYQYHVVNNAKVMADVFILRNFNVVSGSTFNHLFLIDLVNKNLTGHTVSEALSCANIIVNKNSIPNDYNTPFISSGIRIGTAAITRRGFLKEDVIEVAHWICDIIDNINDKMLIIKIKNKSLNLCAKYPLKNNK